jgi:undecaprenyl diphosphate synthase
MNKKAELNHIAFIVDGNRRWAKKKGLSVVAGHRLAANKTIEEIVFFLLKKKVPYVTFWAFSTENWKRGKSFTDLLFGVLRKTLEKSIDKYYEAGIRINTIGDLSRLPEDLVEKIEKLKQDSKGLTKMTVTIALNYGGRDEIVRAIRKLVKSEGIDEENVDEVTEEMFSRYLDTRELPDVDLIVRTGGEQRMSGFMPWQSVYAEYAFTKTLFPDLRVEEVEGIVDSFMGRDRRLGA